MKKFEYCIYVALSVGNSFTVSFICITGFGGSTVTISYNYLIQVLWLMHIVIHVLSWLLGGTHLIASQVISLDVW